MGRRGFSGPPTSPPEPSRLATHDHEWRPDHASPVIEDGAAIFTEVCRWAETKSVDMGRHGTEEVVAGAECDEVRRYRFEAAWAERKRDGKPNVTYLASEFDHFWLQAEEAFIAVECGGGEITSIDPDEDLGQVTVETGEWRVKYKADHDPQIDPRPR
jgi:hypothetical protein